MAGKPWLIEEDEYLREHYPKGTDLVTLAEVLGRTVASVRNRARELELRWASGRTFSIAQAMSPPRSIPSLLEQQFERYRHKQENAKQKQSGIDIMIHEPGPFGLLCFGDPHVGDDGCDMEQLIADMDFARATEHVYAINMGDLSNNWVGPLKRLWAHQGTTEEEEEALVAWLIEYLPWVVVILGNHDKWSPMAARICRDRNVFTVSHGGRLVFRTPGGRPLYMDARHDHRGFSMYNPAHAQIRKKFRGNPCDVIIGAHTHESGYTKLYNDNSKTLGHCVQVASYKDADEYADAKDLSNSKISPSVLIVVDPQCDGIGFVHVFEDLSYGALFLQALRDRYEHTHPSSDTPS